MKPVKHHVTVRVRFNTEGEMTPLFIQWPDGRAFKLKVTDIRNAASACGGAGRRYTVNIAGQERYLFYVNDFGQQGQLCFFIESKKYFKAGDKHRDAKAISHH